MSWAPELVTLFKKLKVGFTSSPILEIFDPDKLMLLKKDWRAEGMGWFLMQPEYDKESQCAIRTL